MASSIFYSQNLAPDQYINWGITSGSNGYGIRDNAGTIEFKDTGGSWAPISSSSSGGGWQRVGTVVSLVTGTDTIGSNLRPTDETYTLGDITHRWSELNAAFLVLSTGAGDAVNIFPGSDGTLEVDLPSGGYIFGDDATNIWSIGDGILVDGQNTTQNVILGKSRFSDRGYHPNPFAGSRFLGEYEVTTQAGSFAAIAGFYSSFIATDGTPPTDGMVGLISRVSYGTAGAAAKGDVNALSGDMIVSGSGSASNEYAAINGAVRMDIGTGYTQAIGPTGRIWGLDLGVMGPIAVQPRLLDGGSIIANNYYNGSPADSASGALWLVTAKAGGPGNDGTHGAANSYPIDVGLGIVGVSNAGSDAIGFTTAIQVGGAGSGWAVTSSLIGTALKGRDIVTYGLDLAATEGADLVLRLASDEGDDATDVWLLKVLASGNAMTWTNAAALAMTLTTAGVLTPVTVQPSTSYKAVDGSTGATGTATAANTLTVKNGLITAIA